MTRECPALSKAIGMRRILEMKLQPRELEFLSAWAREERASNPYTLPAHQLQAAHGVKGVSLIRLIKAWARSEGRRDEDIFALHPNPAPPWPWPDKEQLAARLAEIGPATASGTKGGDLPDSRRT
jgi:hypothetical protein